jgi:hypothetical protein
MWAEPLIASTREIASHTVAVTVHDGGGLPVAGVLCLHNARAGFGVFGEMHVLDDRGGPKQTRRALVLLVREALRYAERLGITHVRAEAPERLTPFAARLAGIEGVRLGRTRRAFETELHQARTATLAISGDEGSLRGLTPKEDEELDAAVDLRS